MTFIWSKLFKRSVPAHEATRDPPRAVQTTKGGSTFPRLSGSFGSEQQVRGNQTAETQTGESRASENRETRINCEERIHYPLYDPTNPHHNPHASKRGHRRSTATDENNLPTETQSTRRSLRRARSTIAAFAHTLRLKGAFRRPPIPVVEEQFGPASDRSVRSQSNCDLKYQVKSRATSPDLDNSNYRSGDTASMIVNLGSSTRRPASRRTSGGGRQADVDCTTNTLAKSRHVAAPFADHKANFTREEKTYLLPIADDGISGLSASFTEWLTTLPPTYSVRDEGYDADEEATRDSTIAPPISDASGNTTFATRTTVKGTQSSNHIGAYEGTAASISGAPVSRGPSLVVSDMGNDGSRGAKSYASVVRSTSGENREIPKISETSPSGVSSSQFLDIPKQRPSPQRKRVPSEAATEHDSDFGFEIYRTCRHEDNSSMTDGDSSLRRVPSVSGALSEMGGRSRVPSDNVSTRCHDTTQTDPEAEGSPVVANYSYRNPVACRQTYAPKSDPVDNISQSRGYTPHSSRLQRSSEAVLTNVSNVANEGEEDCGQGGADSQEANVETSSSSFTLIEAGSAGGGTAIQSAPLSTSSSASCLIGRAILPQIQGALRHAVEAIDRVSGYELPEPNSQPHHTDVYFPVQQSQGGQENRPPKRASGHNQESSSNDSNESGQSDPSSSVAAETGRTSRSSVCDCPPTVASEGVSGKYGLENLLEQGNNRLETAPAS